MRPDDQFEIVNVRAERASAKALGCYFGDDDRLLHWVPVSQILPCSEVQRKGDRGRLIVTAWLAERAKLGTPDDTSVRRSAHSVPLPESHQFYTRMIGRWQGTPEVVADLKTFWRLVQADLDRAAT